ncbi:MAG: YbhB/YbcL family Raf kinase inhibitor-like protein [Spirochaetales bacterium]|nr:YbhB/YbcL family Raf kinase inhibitor-like protein [Spirochaetales bacterium]
MTITSTAFEDGGPIPAVYSCKGDDSSPPLTWSGAPEDTRTFVLICDDPDAPIGTWVHWVYFDIPAETTGLKEGVPSGADPSTGGVQGKNSWKRNDYGGPCPPFGTHRYFFKLYALDAVLVLGSDATKAKVEKAMEGHILAQAQLMGTFKK